MVAAVKAADLVDVIGGAKAMTIFAPTNDAFAKVISTKRDRSQNYLERA